VGRGTSALRPDDIDRLPGACARCLRWERFVDGARQVADRRAAAPADRTGTGDTPADKRRWWMQTMAAGSGGGVVIRATTGDRQSGRVLAYATYAVPRRAEPNGSGPERSGSDRRGADALRVLGLHVDEHCRGVGLGRVLVQALAREALRRPRIKAVEALAGGPLLVRGVGPGCLVPLDFWLACGFEVTRQHPVTPTVRLDARVLAAWRTEMEEALEQAWGRLRGAVRPEPAPRPALSGQPRSCSPTTGAARLRRR